MDILTVCGAISIIGGAIAIVWKSIKPAVDLSKKVDEIEKEREEDMHHMVEMEKLQKQIAKTLASLINHQITGNGIDEMKKLRDELLSSIIDSGQ